MSAIEQDVFERVDTDAKLIGNLLEKKDASGPCLRCKNDRFYAFEFSETLYLVVCSHCGLKFEHVRSILDNPDTVNSSAESEEEEQSQ